MCHNYAWYVQEVAHKPHSPRIESGRGHDRSNGCTRRHSQRDPSVAATAVHMALLMLVYLPFGLGCVCEKALAPGKRQLLNRRRRRRGPGQATVGCHGVRWKTKLVEQLTHIRLIKALGIRACHAYVYVRLCMSPQRGLFLYGHCTTVMF